VKQTAAVKFRRNTILKTESIRRLFIKSIEEILSSTSIADMHASMSKRRSDARKSFTDIAAEPVLKYMNKPQLKELIDQMFIEMKNAARDLDFERAAELRDELGTLKEKF